MQRLRPLLSLVRFLNYLLFHPKELSLEDGGLYSKEQSHCLLLEYKVSWDDVANVWAGFGFQLSQRQQRLGVFHQRGDL